MKNERTLSLTLEKFLKIIREYYKQLYLDYVTQMNWTNSQKDKLVKLTQEERENLRRPMNKLKC